MRSWFGRALLLVLAVMTSPHAAEATVSEALSLDELVQRADHVVLATAVDRSARRDARGRIVTDFVLRVEEAMKGGAPVGSTLTMTRIGGRIGDLGMHVEGEPHLEIGQRYLLFLARSPAGTLRPVGMSQGVMPVQDRAGERVVMPGGGGLALVQPGPGGRLAPAPGALLYPEPYVDVRARVGRAVERNPGTVRP